MKVVKYDKEKDEIFIRYSMQEFKAEMSRASAFMNLYRTFEKDKPDDGQLKLDLDNQSSCSEETDTTNEEVVQEVLSKEEEKERRKQEKKKRDEELRRTDPYYGLKKKGLKIINTLHDRWGKNMVDIDSDEFKIFHIKSKIKLGDANVILKRLHNRGFCEIYYKGKVRPLISQFKFKF